MPGLTPSIGILALQGAFDAHARMLQSLGAKTVFVRKPEQLEGIDGLVIPGGESTTFLKALLGLVRAAGDPEEYFWRCMDGAVFVCAIGANIPCRSKADRSRRNVGAEAFCRETGNADFVPAYAAGHGTIYEWRCVSGAAVRGKAIAQLDRRGFQRDFWHRLAPGGTG